MNLLISEVQLGCVMASNPARISLTFDDHGTRSSTDFEPSSQADFTAYASILALSRPRYFEEGALAIMTTEMDVDALDTDPQTVGGPQLVREIEARWQQGAGGWIVLRLVNWKRLLYRFEPTQALSFAAAIATFENGPVYFIPNVGVLRGTPESTPPPQWGPF